MRVRRLSFPCFGRKRDGAFFFTEFIYCENYKSQKQEERHYKAPLVSPCRAGGEGRDEHRGWQLSDANGEEAFAKLGGWHQR